VTEEVEGTGVGVVAVPRAVDQAVWETEAASVWWLGVVVVVVAVVTGWALMGKSEPLRLPALSPLPSLSYLRWVSLADLQGKYTQRLYKRRGGQCTGGVLRDQFMLCFLAMADR